MYPLIRNLLFRLPPETAHHLALKMIAAGNCLGLNKRLLPTITDHPSTVMGLHFANPVGLAAGFDKNADYLSGLGSLGFGFIEVGTVTPKPQPGNPPPRLFRLPAQQALINRMGFNNQGIDHMVAKLRNRQYTGIIGVNIGKQFNTPVAEASNDYVICLRNVYPYADYVVINLSSPNTPGLRTLQTGDAFKQLLDTLKQEQQTLKAIYHRTVPLVVKIAPDMTDEDLGAIAHTLLAYELDGVIATNTTLARAAVQGSPHAHESGGLSGEPLADRSTAVVKILADVLSGRIPIIGVGGIMDAATAAAKIRAGASLVQVYSGFIYKGPSIIREAVEGVYAGAMA